MILYAGNVQKTQIYRGGKISGCLDLEGIEGGMG